MARDAMKQVQVHLLDPDDLVWMVAEIGAWESSWKVGPVVAEWLYHHGPKHRALVEAAEEIADYDNAQWLDEVLLWLEPTPNRWYQCACWHVTCGHGPDPLEDCANHARWVIEQRGESARRSLLAAPMVAEPDSDARRVLDAWAGALS